MAAPTQMIDAIKRRRHEMNSRPMRRRRLPRQLPPTAIERQYRRILRQYVNIYTNLVREIIFPQLENIVSEAKTLRPDRMDDWSDHIAALIESTRVSFNSSAPDPDLFAPQIGTEVSQHNRKEFNKTVKAAVGVDVFIAEPWLGSQLNSFSRENVALIKSIPEQNLTQVEGIVQRGVRNGTPTREIQQEISSQFGVAERRAELIARDQVSKLNGQLSQFRQREVGVERYTWRTSLDERVRESHAELEGKIFTWSDPPSVGAPGEDFNCRCYAEPILDDLIDAVEE